jgi:hypothetical protein
MVTAEKVAQVFTASRPEAGVDANPVSVDKAGPVFKSAGGDRAAVDLMSVQRKLWPDRPPVRLRLYPDPSGNGYLNEFIAGDIVSVSGVLLVRENLDGEAQEDGDPLTSSDIELDARTLEGGHRELGPVEREFFQVDRGWLVPMEIPAVGEAQFFATAIVAGITDILTQGDYTQVDLSLGAVDDVGLSDQAVVHVRVDTRPPILEELSFTTTSTREITVDGVRRPVLSVGDHLAASAIIGLNGDPADAPWVVMQASALQPQNPEVQNLLPPTPLDAERVRVDIGAEVAPAAPNTLGATVGIFVRDDAGNTVYADSADYGFIFAIETVPTLTPGMTPTPTLTLTPTPSLTPTETPTPTLVPSAGDLNGDGVVDRMDLFIFARSWLAEVEEPGAGPDLVPDAKQRIDEADLRRLWDILHNLSGQLATPSPTPSPTPGPPTPTPTPQAAG